MKIILLSVVLGTALFGNDAFISVDTLKNEMNNKDTVILDISDSPKKIKKTEKRTKLN